MQGGKEGLYSIFIFFLFGSTKPTKENIRYDMSFIAFKIRCYFISKLLK
jgi:hypothetical protein